MPSTITSSRGMVITARVAIVAATFAVGWYSLNWTKSTPGSAHNNTNDGSVLKNPRDELSSILRSPAGNNRERDMISLIDKLDARTLKGMLAGLMTDATDEVDRKAVTAMLARMAELDPQAALGLLKGLQRTDFVEDFFDAWSAKDPTAALAAISQLPADSARDTVTEKVFSNIVDQNPESALVALHSRPINALTGSLYQTVFAEWANLDPVAAATAALKLPPSAFRSGAFDGVVGAWAEQDATGAMAWANALPSGQLKKDLVNSVIVTMSQQDPQAAAAYVLQIPPGSNRQDLISNIADNWAASDPAGLLKWADKNLTGDTFAETTLKALSQMSQTDPAAAATALAQIPDPNVIKLAVNELAMDWAGQDVQGAMKWAQTLSTDNVAVRNSAFSTVLKSWSGYDPAAAAAYIQQNLISDPSFDTLAAQVANSWGSTAPQAALIWAEALPEGAAHETAITAVLTQIAKTDPQAAWTDALQLSDNNRDNALVNIIGSWAGQQPAQAAAALANLPQGTSLDTATANVAKIWLEQDPSAATQWISNLPQSTARDNAVTQLVASLGKNDPGTAYNWALSIGDSTIRNPQIVNLVKQWSNANPTAAAAAAQNALNLTGLTNAQYNSLQKIVNKSPTP